MGYNQTCCRIYCLIVLLLYPVFYHAEAKRPSPSSNIAVLNGSSEVQPPKTECLAALDLELIKKPIGQQEDFIVELFQSMKDKVEDDGFETRRIETIFATFDYWLKKSEGKKRTRILSTIISWFDWLSRLTHYFIPVLDLLDRRSQNKCDNDLDRFVRGFIALYKKDYDQALPVLEEFLTLKFFDYSASLRLPRAYAQSVGTQEGIRRIEAINKKHKNNEFIMICLGELYSGIGDKEKTIELLTNPIVDKYDHRATFLLGETYYLSGDYQKAEEYLKLHFLKDPDHHAGLALYWDILMKKGRFVEVVADLRERVKLHPDECWFSYELAKFYIWGGKILEAKEMLYSTLTNCSKQTFHPTSVDSRPVTWYFGAFHLLIDLFRKEGDFGAIDRLNRDFDMYYGKNIPIGERKFNPEPQDKSWQTQTLTSDRCEEIKRSIGRNERNFLIDPLMEAEEYLAGIERYPEESIVRVHRISDLVAFSLYWYGHPLLAMREIVLPNVIGKFMALLLDRRNLIAMNQVIERYRSCLASPLLDTIEGLTAVYARQYERALPLLETGVLHPFLIDPASLYLPMVYLETVGVLDGQKRLKKIMTGLPPQKQIYNCYASMAVIRKDTAKAIEWLEKSYALDKSDERTTFLLAQQYEAIGNDLKKVFYIRQHLLKQPYHHAALAMYWKELLKQGDEDEIMKSLSRLIEQRPDDGWFRLELAKFLYSKGRSQEARFLLETTLNFYEKKVLDETIFDDRPEKWYFSAVNLLGEILRNQGDFVAIDRLYHRFDRLKIVEVSHRGRLFSQP